MEHERSDKDAERAKFSRVGQCVATGSERVIIASAITVEWADRIVDALASKAERAPSGESINALWAEMQRLSRYRYSNGDGMVAAPSGGFYSCTDVQAMIAEYVNARRATAGTTAAPAEPPMRARYRVKIRRTDGMQVKPEAEQIDGKEWEFTRGWLIEDENSRYPGEWAMLPSQGQGWPDGAPGWVATGDLVKQLPKADV